MTVLKRATPTVIWGHSSPRTRDTYIHCWAFGSGAVTTCFYDLGLSRLGFEHPTFPLRGKRSNRLHHQRGFENMCCKKSFLIPLQDLCFYVCKWNNMTWIYDGRKRQDNYIIFLFIRFGLYSCRHVPLSCL